MDEDLRKTSKEIAKSSFKLRAAVDAFRGVPQGRAAGAWDEHAACMDRSRDRYS